MPNKIIEEDIGNSALEVGDFMDKLEGSRILITGAAGFVCSYFVDFVECLNKTRFKEPCKIIGVDNLITGIKKNLLHLMRSKNLKILEKDLSKEMINEDVDYIIHGASIASPTFYRKYPIETMDVNVNGTRNMLELARKKDVKSFLFISTSEVYGDPPADFIPTKEDFRGFVSCTGPRACYDESKRFGETLCTNYNKVYSVPVKITRPFNFYGPRLHLNDRRIIPDLLRNALNNENLKLYSDGKATRSFCYISDAVTGHFKVLLSDFNGEVFNVGNGQEETSMKELAEMIIDLTNKDLKVEYKKSSEKAYLKDNPQMRCPDITKIKTKLGYEPKVSLKRGLLRTINWHKQNIEVS
tara:strand:- start:23087 stop:24151 length:1065 start_codon:yes stop_codon:yes gene_type:complete